MISISKDDLILLINLAFKRDISSMNILLKRFDLTLDVK